MSKKWPPGVAARATSWCWWSLALAVSHIHLGIRKDNMRVFLRGAALQASQSFPSLFPVQFSLRASTLFPKTRALWVRLFKINISWIFSLHLRAQMYSLVVGASWSKSSWSCGVVGITAEAFQNPVVEKIKSCHFLYEYLLSCKKGSLKKITRFPFIARPTKRCHHFCDFK